MAEDRREQELRAAAKQLAGVQRQHRPDQTAAARSQAGQKAQPQRAAQQATAQTAAARSQAGQKAQPQRAAQQATTQTAAAQSHVGQKAQPQRTAQQATAQTAAAQSQAGQKCSHREQPSKRQLRQQIPTVAERLCPGSRYSRCGRQIHLRKNPCHRQSRSNISWNKKSQSITGCRILCGSPRYRSGSVAGNVQEGRRSYRFLCKEKQRDRCSHKSTDTTGKR